MFHMSSWTASSTSNVPRATSLTPPMQSLVLNRSLIRIGIFTRSRARRLLMNLICDPTLRSGDCVVRCMRRAIFSSEVVDAQVTRKSGESGINLCRRYFLRCAACSTLVAAASRHNGIFPSICILRRPRELGHFWDGIRNRAGRRWPFSSIYLLSREERETLAIQSVVAILSILTPCHHSSHGKKFIIISN